MFQREEWTLFRNLSTIGQKAGVPLDRLAEICCKELVDNALDAGAKATIDRTMEGVVITDNGPGISADPNYIARLFSINRPLISSKLIRLPMRGALGNGLRVVVGAVLASRGTLTVENFGLKFILTPQNDGSTSVETEASSVYQGTSITLSLGDGIPVNRDSLNLSEVAISMAPLGDVYKGKTSPWWYEEEAFFEMFAASGDRPVEDILELFHGIKPAFARELANGRVASQIDHHVSRNLLIALREQSPKPSPAKLGKMGDAFSGFGYQHMKGEIPIKSSGIAGSLPYSMEVYAVSNDDGSDSITLMVNRTPVVGDLRISRIKPSTQVGIFGCGLSHAFEVGRKGVTLYVNITTPFMPITSDGKLPDLKRYIVPLAEALKKACAKARRLAAKDSAGKVISQRSVIADNLDEAIAKASGDGTYRYSLRQLFYAVRPYMLEAFGKEPDYNYFAQMITDIEAERGEDLPGIYRDARGTLYHPHLGEDIPLGTMNVEKYQRPAHTIRHVLYLEKEGFNNLLKDTQWPERNDCALLTSKGFASRAARDVIDLLGESEEELNFYCIHDSDASGTLIYQALTEATRARGARKVKVINLGLDPWEAVNVMGLQVETFKEASDSKRKLPVANYVHEYDGEDGEGYWADWLQTRRVELNAMTSPQFLAWLDKKFEPYKQKVVPDHQVLRTTFNDQGRKAIEAELARKILKEAGFEDQVAKAMEHLAQAAGEVDFEQIVRDGLEEVPEHRWDNPLGQVADQMAKHTIG